MLRADCLPVDLYRAAQTRELDRLAIEHAGLSSYELMTRAGSAAFGLLRRLWPEARALQVWCGSGNNGGDGYVIARLARAAGWQVTVYALAPRERLRDAALKACRDYLEHGGTVIDYDGTRPLPSQGVIVDALLGTGLDRDVSGLYAQAIAHLNAANRPVLAIDIPSGIDADTGAMWGCAVQATATISFIGIKQGLLTGAAPQYCGELHFDNLGVPAELYAAVTPSARRLTTPSWPKRPRDSHKGHFGHVLIIGGHHGYSGAARLAAEAAARVGAGLVSVATRAAHAALLNTGRPELMCHACENEAALLPLLQQATVIVIGPGLGQEDWGRRLLLAALRSGLPLVVDADALNLIAQQPCRNECWILTPHPGEAARLLGQNSATIQRDRFAAARALQQYYGGVVVLKGAGTLIDDGKHCYVATCGNPGMASGGMGDVLAGVIGGLWAQGWPAWDAACRGVVVHGSAADRAAQNGGERGLLASDVLPYLRQEVNR